MRDGRLELVRHFLILGAKNMGLVELAKAIERWECQGVGVWVGVEEQVLEHHPGVFDAAVRAVERFGDTVDAAYLNTVLRRRGTKFLMAQKVRLIVDELNALRDFVVGVGAQHGMRADAPHNSTLGSMANAVPSVGDIVRIRSTPETQSLGLAGLAGQVYGSAAMPSTANMAVIGSPPNDAALNVVIEGQPEDLWFNPELVELVDDPDA